jgi:hypothetical protein
LIARSGKRVRDLGCLSIAPNGTTFKHPEWDVAFRNSPRLHACQRVTQLPREERDFVGPVGIRRQVENHTPRDTLWGTYDQAYAGSIPVGLRVYPSAAHHSGECSGQAFPGRRRPRPALRPIYRVCVQYRAKQEGFQARAVPRGAARFILSALSTRHRMSAASMWIDPSANMRGFAASRLGDTDATPPRNPMGKTSLREKIRSTAMGDAAYNLD